MKVPPERVIRLEFQKRKRYSGSESMFYEEETADWWLDLRRNEWKDVRSELEEKIKAHAQIYAEWHFKRGDDPRDIKLEDTDGYKYLKFALDLINQHFEK